MWLTGRAVCLASAAVGGPGGAAGYGCGARAGSFAAGCPQEFKIFEIFVFLAPRGAQKGTFRSKTLIFEPVPRLFLCIAIFSAAHVARAGGLRGLLSTDIGEIHNF